jgi:hypothetical protein
MGGLLVRMAHPTLCRVFWFWVCRSLGGVALAMLNAPSSIVAGLALVLDSPVLNFIRLSCAHKKALNRQGFMLKNWR